MKIRNEVVVASFKSTVRHSPEKTKEHNRNLNQDNLESE
jgi:hypothetical protein